MTRPLYGPCSLLSIVIIYGNKGRGESHKKGILKSVFLLWASGAQSFCRGRNLGSLSVSSGFLLFEGSPPTRPLLPAQRDPGSPAREDPQAEADPGRQQGTHRGRQRNPDGIRHCPLHILPEPFCSLTSGEGRFLNRLTYVFKEGSRLQHYLFEVEAHVSVCEQLQDLF